MTTNSINLAKRLLSLNTPKAESLPARIEELNLAAFDITTHIDDLKDRAGVIEEEATAEASAESNADKRKVKRSEILRDSEEYQALKSGISSAERLRAKLQERSHRYAREHRAIVADAYARVF